MADRKAELERKKARLEQMRKERQEKEKMKKMKESTGDGSPKMQGQDLRAETEQLLRDIGIDPDASSSSQNASSAFLDATKPEGHEGEQSLKVSPHPSPKRTAAKLTMVKVNETSIPPRENVTYSKETQTVVVEVEREDDDGDSVDTTVDTPPPHKMPHVELVQPATTQEDLDRERENKAPKVRDMSEEEKQQIMLSSEFQTFFNKTTQYVERALVCNVNITEDYTGGDRDGNDDDILAGERLKINRTFYDERWTKHRTITSLDWSTKYPELLVASYNGNEDSPRDPDGVALIWNVKFRKETPEFIFHCQSALMSCCFAEFHPNLVIGGTYSGQIVLWDNRVNKRTPVQRTPLSAAAHTHPVYCLNVVGTQNAHNLISISTDGKMCSWSLDMLSQPHDSMELQHKQSKNVAVTCMCFFSGDVNNFIIGSEETLVYSACRHGSKAGINEAFEGHHAPVVGIDCHSVPGQIDFSPYFLTSSFDWTIKLWSMKDQKYIHSFEDNSEYIYDVQWSPIHPALFASVDGMGRLDLWHLNNDTEVPSASIVGDNIALNKCRWHKSGNLISAGDDEGKIYIYDVGEHIANPKPDEWSRFVQTLQELRQHAVEREEDASLATLTGQSLHI